MSNGRYAYQTKDPLDDRGFVVCKFKIYDSYTVFCSDHSDRDGYIDAIPAQIALVEEKIGKPWLGLREILAEDIERRCQEAIIKLEDPKKLNYMMKLYYAARLHAYKKYSNKNIPDEIVAYADTNNLTAKQASMKIIKDMEDFNKRIDELNNIRIYGPSEYLTLPLENIQLRHEEFIRNIEELVDFFH